MSTAATKPGAVAKAEPNPLVVKLEQFQREYGPAALAAVGEMARAVKVAEGIESIRGVVKQLLPQIRPLMGRPLGFLTDRDNSPNKGPYSDDVIVECCTEAVLRGLSWTGNQFNVIGGRFYATKEGYARLVRELPGLTDLELRPGVPKMYDGGAVVPFKATWRLGGRPKSLDLQIPVRLNAGMGVDGAIGKAKRKMLAHVWATSTGSELGDVDDATEPGDPPPALADGKADELKGRLAAAVADPPPADGRLFADAPAGMPD